ncbi:hypothetical protein SFUL_5515 [Streptomyces microflavus DSM 40593]|uniref:Uncharacterized protein n=1 Tax=Streptomyces microflavus DSM 40593 TaxID=1303692 RepID=N0D3F1_STRMI|nr:hypothetical protein [Streptomyces microflavus]AGK80403.1 hypothetical protein SFUL_5515 [Streptomyces microflavus DSM 40593]
MLRRYHDSAPTDDKPSGRSRKPRPVKAEPKASPAEPVTPPPRG